MTRDPLGVNEIPEARDEYYSYIFDLIEMKKRNVSVQEMANHLYGIEKDHMGLFLATRIIAKKWPKKYWTLQMDRRKQPTTFSFYKQKGQPFLAHSQMLARLPITDYRLSLFHT